MSHIVVAIPAVEDSDLPETVRHLYALSSRQHRLTVVVHEQCSEHGRFAPVELPYFDADWHEYIYLHSDEPRGCWPARRHISSYLRERDINGDYGMVIDSHTRFRADWDACLIDLHRRAQEVEWLGQSTTDAVLTGLMHPHLWGDSWNRIPVTLYKQEEWKLGGFMPFLKPMLFDPLPDHPFLQARHFAGCASFGPFDMLHLWQVHGDTIVFNGEEHVMALEVFRAGWGLFHCQLPFAHLALRPDKRPWETNPEWPELNKRSFAYQRKVLHADIGSCSEHCAANSRTCMTEQYP